MMIESSSELGVVPDGIDELDVVDWVPADSLAVTIVELVDASVEGDAMPICYLMNPMWKYTLSSTVV
jgi:hypothetical protein